MDVGGSFVATTADTIKFADGTSFDARNPNVSLTISVPIGLGLYGNNGSITVNGSGNQITGNSTFSPIQFEQRPTGLSVSEGNTLALVGNGIDFNGGVVTTQGGNIYLTSGESGSVGISQEENGLTLIDDGVTKYQDINLNQQSLVDISGEKVGTVLLTGKTVHLSDASFILAQTQSNAPGGSINIKASEEVLLTGNSPDGEIASTIRSEVLKTAEERGATVYISANRLAMQDEAKIQAMTYSDSPNGIGGQLNINAVESIKVNSSRMSASAFAEGNAGGINISTSELRLIEAASITSSTIGKGDGGEVNIQADLMEVVGANQDAISNISASTFRSGDAGNININTQILRVKDGGSVSSSSFADGNAGSLDINASESIEVSGKSDIFADRSNSQSLIRTMTQLTPPELRGRLNVPDVPTGNAGNLTISTPSLTVNKQAIITVANQGSGSAGTLTINANNLSLDTTGRVTAAAESGIGGNIILNTKNLNISNDSQITASASGNQDGGNITINTTNLTAKKNNQITASAFEGEGGNLKISAESLSLNDRDSIAATSELGNGGNINLNTARLQVENNSNISASAGGEGNGGNIEITGENVFVLENSKISANAVRGNGGNINITADGVFVSPDSTITATSELGIDGAVTIDTLSSDLEKDLKQSEPEIADLSALIAKTCLSNQRGQSSLVRGSSRGIPFNPDSEYRNLNFTLTGVGSWPEGTNDESRSLEQNLITSEEEPIIPATKMIRTKDGEIYLIASWQEARELLCSKD